MTYTDMVAFAESVEVRPLLKLLEELPDIASLSDSKFRIASTVMRRRFRLESPIEQIQLRRNAPRPTSIPLWDGHASDRVAEVLARTVVAETAGAVLV